MPTTLDRDKIKKYLENFDLRSLFIEELGWDHGGNDMEVPVGSRSFSLEAIAHKRGFVAYQFVGDSEEAFPEHTTRQKIEKAVAKTVREHLIVYTSHDRNTLYWQWVKRERGRPDLPRQHIYYRGQPGEALIQKLEQLAFTLDEEDDTTIVEVSGQVCAAFDVEKVTKKFYEHFKKEHHVFLGFIKGIEKIADREWYASLMLNRMMFIYFIQKRGFLNGDPDYLRNRLQSMQATHGKDRFQTFYRLFLLRLFHEGLGQPEADRAPELAALLGQVPYLNGGLFDVHDLERNNPEIHVPDKAFEQIFAFFDAYQWHLDDRPLHKDNEINPDVLGYIFEKYINQKQMGAYYTKEDITRYISRNTIIPFLFDRAKKECPIAFKPDGGVWRLLSDDPDRYFYEAVRHGITYDLHKREALAEKRDLPSEIAAGLNDVSQRGGWNQPAHADYALPTETWREHVARRQRYEEIHAKLAAGEATSINDLITYNLDIEKFAQDVIAGSEGPELIRAFWKALNTVSILDPTCGSGAFLFAALNILEPIYTTCLEAMRGFLDDLERSKRKHRPEKMKDFRAVLEQIASHASERYFILKTIIISNLYGVDIMEEAVEICKLRLFLKLVAQLETYKQIEPLPDVDFNVRAGNTLVGFTSLKEVQQALGTDLIDQLSLPDIEERAELAELAFRRFHEMQTEQGMDASEFATTKVELRKRLDDLRNELDLYLAGDYGVKLKSKRAYQKWRDSHQPFHWFVEFYGIVNGGGFDVIIGNPPYVEYHKVRTRYTVNATYKTLPCGNLYTLVLERSYALSGSGGWVSLIVPLSLVCTSKTEEVRKLVKQFPSWLSTYDMRPGSLFEGVAQRLTIIISQNRKTASTGLFMGGFRRWVAEERQFLIAKTNYCSISRPQKKGPFPKLFIPIEQTIFAKIDGVPLAQLSTKTSNPIVVHRIVRYFIKALNFVPLFVDTKGNRSRSQDYKNFHFEEEHRDYITALLNSTVFYWFWRTHCDGFHCGYNDVYSMPYKEMTCAESRQSLKRVLAELMLHFQYNSEERSIRTHAGNIRYQEFYPARSKRLVDKIDGVLAEHYGFTDEELDFIINYDIKYRMGREGVDLQNGN